jgi:hypothetical protein
MTALLDEMVQKKITMTRKEECSSALKRIIHEIVKENQELKMRAATVSVEISPSGMGKS